MAAFEYARLQCLAPRQKKKKKKKLKVRRKIARHLNPLGVTSTGGRGADKNGEGARTMTAAFLSAPLWSEEANSEQRVDP